MRGCPPHPAIILQSIITHTHTHALAHSNFFLYVMEYLLKADLEDYKLLAKYRNVCVRGSTLNSFVIT